MGSSSSVNRGYREDRLVAQGAGCRAARNLKRCDVIHDTFRAPPLSEVCDILPSPQYLANEEECTTPGLACYSVCESDWNSAVQSAVTTPSTAYFTHSSDLSCATSRCSTGSREPPFVSALLHQLDAKKEGRSAENNGCKIPHAPSPPPRAQKPSFSRRGEINVARMPAEGDWEGAVNMSALRASMDWELSQKVPVYSH